MVRGMTGQGPAASESFIYSLSPDVRGILCPDLLIAPADLEAEIERRKVQHGVYAWWFDAELALVPREGCVQLGTHHLVYIGIAPPMRADVGARRLTPIRRRLLRNHLHGSIRRSTLRQSLAAILADNIGFVFTRDASGRLTMARNDEARLSEWLLAHAAVSFVHSDDPWHVESALVRGGPALPLNLSMSNHPFRETLSALRRQLGRDGSLENERPRM